MAATIRGISSGAAYTHSFSTTKPAGLQVGDFMVLVLEIAIYSSGYIPSTPSGWTRQAYHQGSYGAIYLYTKWATQTDVDSWSCSFSWTNDQDITWSLRAVYNVDTTTPILGSAAASTASTSSPSLSITATPASTYDMVLCVFCGRGTSARSSNYATTNSNPSNWAEDAEFQSGSNDHAAASGNVSGTTALSAVTASTSTTCRHEVAAILLKGLSGMVPVSNDLDASYDLRAYVSSDLDGSYDSRWQRRNGVFNPRVKDDLDFWEGTATLTRETTTPGGSYPAGIDAHIKFEGATVNKQMRTGAGSGLPVTAADAGKTLAASWYSYAPATRGGNATFLWYDAGGDLLGTTSVTAPQGATADWTRRGPYTAAVPSHPTLAYAGIQWANTSTGTTLYFSGFALELLDSDATDYGYADGDLAGWAWSEEAHGSVSGNLEPTMFVLGRLDGSYDVWAYVGADLEAGYEMVGIVGSDLEASYDLRAIVSSDLDSSHRITQEVFRELAGLYAIEAAGLPAAAPRILHVPALSLLLGEAERIDLIAEGGDATTVRFGNAVTGGHGGASIEIPKRPARRAVNGLVRGTPARLYDGADLLYQGVVKKVSGSDGGDGRSVTRVEFCGPMDLADLDESFAWTWVDADYAAWQEVTLPTGPFQTSKGQSGTYAEYAPRDASWEVRSDGELFIGTVAGSTYYGDPFYVRKPCLKRLAYCLDRRTLSEWPSGNALRMGRIMAIEFDWRVKLTANFKAEVGTAYYPSAPTDTIAVAWTKTNLTDAGYGERADLSDGPCVFLQLSHYAQTDHVGAGEFVQLLHVRVAVRPDGPASRSWAFGDAFPTLQDCFADLLSLGGATTVEAEQISEALPHARVEGPTLSDACQALADADEDEDGTGQPLEYGIWDEGRGVVRRRPQDPDDQSQWLAIDTERDDVSVEVDYEEALDAPDFVEVRYAYLKTNLIRHHSPAEAGYWSDRGRSDDRPYDWSFGGSGTYEHDVVSVDGQRRYAMSIGPGTYDAAWAQFPVDGQYPVAPVSGQASQIPLILGAPIRAQIWARRTGTVNGNMMLWYYHNGSPRGSDTLIAVNGEDWRLWRADWLTDPTSAANAMRVEMRIESGSTSAEGTFYWRNAQLYYLIPEGTELSAWYPHEPPTFGTHTVKTFELEQPATLWAARNCARRYWQSFRRGVGKGTIEARGVLFDVRGREVPVSRIRGGWWASIVNDPRCRSPLYVSSVECSPEGLEATLGIGGELPPWSDRRRARERPRFGRYADWRGFAPGARRRR